MKKILFTLSILTAIGVNAQDTRKDILSDASMTITKDKADTTSKPWLLGGVLNLNGAQTNLSNWSAGGDDYSLSINALADLHAYYKKGKQNWDNMLTFNYGYIKTTSLGNRKNSDRIDLLSRYGYSLNKNWEFGGLFNFRTQAFAGYTYATTDNITTKTYSSNFFSPAYVSIGPGFTYHPTNNNNLNIYISPASARWIIVSSKFLNNQGLYGVDSGKTIKTQVGAYLSANYTTNITKTLSYIGRLDLFSDYLNKPQNVYVYMTNMFALKISKILSATWNFNMIYDDKTRLFGPTGKGARLQTQSVIGVGILYKFDNK